MKKFLFVIGFAAFIAVSGYALAQYVNAKGVTANACNSGCE